MELLIYGKLFSHITIKYTLLAIDSYRARSVSLVFVVVSIQKTD